MQKNGKEPGYKSMLVSHHRLSLKVYVGGRATTVT